MNEDFKLGFEKTARVTLFRGTRQVSKAHSDYLKRIGATGKSTPERTLTYGSTPGKKGTQFKSITEGTPSTRTRTERGKASR